VLPLTISDACVLVLVLVLMHLSCFACDSFDLASFRRGILQHHVQFCDENPTLFLQGTYGIYVVRYNMVYIGVVLYGVVCYMVWCRMVWFVRLMVSEQVLF
jgi:hypothetical protein